MSKQIQLRSDDLVLIAIFRNDGARPEPPIEYAREELLTDRARSLLVLVSATQGGIPEIHTTTIKQIRIAEVPE